MYVTYMRAYVYVCALTYICMQSVTVTECI